ncbi:MAG: leucine-rich repeat protein, partial [Solirubrobacterales bacterium]|nr:leucine-rich repeat protein [Solirubrobacterales bacterium]
SGLTSINLPTSLTSIGDSAFEMAQSLSTIDLPEGLTTIGENAFVCTTLSSITIPSTVTSIGKQAFACSSLSSVYFQGNAPTVGFGAFGGISRGAKAILASSSLTGYGYNGALFKGLIVSGGLNDPSADTTKPSTPSAFTGVPSNPTSSTTATIGFTLGEAGGTVECKLDTGSWSACTSASGTSGSKSLSGLGDGAHTLSVRQTDAAGNVSNVATTSSWTVDATAPTAPGTFTGVPSGQTASVTATIAFSLGEADGTVECRLDTSSWGACTSVSGTSGSIDLTGLALGTHTLSVRQTDATGNVSTVGTTASWSVVIPTLPPTVLTPAAGTKTVYKKTVDGSNTWAIKTGLLFSTGGDTRSAAQFLTVQVAVDSAGKPVATKPSDSLAPPTSASFNNGVLAWSSTGEVTRSSAATPVWVRVGNKMGRWSAWVKLTA